MQTHKKLNGKVILAILAAGIMAFAGIVVETAMNITFPTLMAEFGVGISTVQWMTTGYLLVVAVIIPISSFFKRRFKTKNLFLVAVLLFSAGVLIDALAPTFPILLLGRIIQGCGTGIALPLMFNIILDEIPTAGKAGLSFDGHCDADYGRRSRNRADVWRLCCFRPSVGAPSSCSCCRCCSSL